MSDPQVLIVGAGPTGLVLALWLARAGVPFRLIDKNSGPAQASRAIVVHARTLEFYRQLGFADDLIALGIPMESFHLRNSHGELATISLGQIGQSESPFPFALSLPQDDHERFLNDRLATAGVSVEWNTELVNFAQDEHGVDVVLRANGVEQTGRYVWLCGCDGAHSAVRRGLGIGFPGGTYDQQFFVADVISSDGPGSRDINVYVEAHSLCLTFPVRTTGHTRYLGLIPDHLHAREDLTFEDLRLHVEGLTGLRPGAVNWFSTYRIHHRVAERYRDRRVFLAGDAGHIHSPAGGQGMNTGIGDAVNLAWKLAAVVQGQAAPRLLETYEQERLPFARALVSTTDRLFQIVVGRGIGSQLFRKVFAPYCLPWLIRWKFIRRAQFRLVSQTRIRYPGSTLSRGRAGSIRAGDRLPWVASLDNFRPLAARQWQLHVYGTPSRDVTSFAAVHNLTLWQGEWSADARQHGLARDAIYLVRPDGYVAFAGQPTDLVGLASLREDFSIVTSPAS